MPHTDQRSTEAATPRLRGRAGQKQRDRRLKRTNYMCEDCLAQGRVKLADEVHHIIGLKDGGSDTDENTANVCIEHHLERENKRVRRRIAVDGWPTED